LPKLNPDKKYPGHWRLFKSGSAGAAGYGLRQVTAGAKPGTVDFLKVQMRVLLGRRTTIWELMPGGWQDDGDCARLCDEKGAAMLLTGMRHFRH